jgi:hypothetical protein
LRDIFVRGVAFAGDQQLIGFFTAFRCEHRRQALGDDAGDALAQADVGEQFGPAAVSGETQQLFPDGMVFLVIRRKLLQAFGAQRLREQLLAQLLRLDLCQ